MSNLYTTLLLLCYADSSYCAAFDLHWSDYGIVTERAVGTFSDYDRRWCSWRLQSDVVRVCFYLELTHGLFTPFLLHRVVIGRIDGWVTAWMDEKMQCLATVKANVASTTSHYPSSRQLLLLLLMAIGCLMAVWQMLNAMPVDSTRCSSLYRLLTCLFAHTIAYLLAYLGFVSMALKMFCCHRGAMEHRPITPPPPPPPQQPLMLVFHAAIIFCSVFYLIFLLL